MNPSTGIHAAGPHGLPLLGSALDLRRDPLAFYSRLEREYGGVARVRVGPIELLVLSAPEPIRHVLMHDVEIYEKGFGNDVLAPLIGDGLFLAEGEAWRARRKLVHQLFRREHIDSLAPIVQRLTREALDHWDEERRRAPERVFDLHAELRDLTLRIASVALVGVDVFAERADLRDLLERLWVQTNRKLRWGGLWLDRVPLPSTLQFRRDLARLADVIAEATRDHDRSRVDLLALLLSARDKSGGGLTDTQIRDEVVTFLLAGQECTSIAMAWTGYLLAKHPAVERATIEQVEALGDDLHLTTMRRQAPIIRQVVRESMRLYPPAWVMARQSRLGDVVGGVELPPGAVTVLCTWALHRSPLLWPSPERFDPTRFAADAEGHDKFAFLPFGVGARMCIGMGFAMLQAETILAMLYGRFRLELACESVVPDPGLTLRPKGGVPVRLRPLR